MVRVAEPIRTCIACGKKRRREDLLRLALREGIPCWDEKKVFPGRGAYLCPDPACLQKGEANHRNCLNRAFRGRNQLKNIKRLSKWTPHETSNPIGGKGSA